MNKDDFNFSRVPDLPCTQCQLLNHSAPDVNIARLMGDLFYHKLTRWQKFKLKIKQCWRRLLWKLRRHKHKSMPLSDLAGENLIHPSCRCVLERIDEKGCFE